MQRHCAYIAVSPFNPVAVEGKSVEVREGDGESGQTRTLFDICCYNSTSDGRDGTVRAHLFWVRKCSTRRFAPCAPHHLDHQRIHILTFVEAALGPVTSSRRFITKGNIIEACLYNTKTEHKLVPALFTFGDLILRRIRIRAPRRRGAYARRV